MSDSGPQRIQKVIAAVGEYSRRAVEKLIDDGLVRVNGQIVRQKGVLVDPEVDKIVINGRPFQRPPELERPIVILLNKPRQVVVSRHDPEGRETVYDLLPDSCRNLKPIGRLDYNTQGALLLTNDGDLILKLTHPRYHIAKIYHAKVTSMPDEKQLGRMRRGIVIDGERTLPADIDIAEKREKGALLEIRLTEGRNRQVRKMCEAVGLTVKELRRVAIGPVELGSLKSGRSRELTARELRALWSELNAEGTPNEKIISRDDSRPKVRPQVRERRAPRPANR